MRACLTLFLLFLITTSPIFSLDLNTFLQQAALKHPYFEAQTLSNDLAQDQLAAASGQEDWILSASGTYVSSGVAENNPFSPNSAQVADAAFTLKRPIWGSGGRLSASLTGSSTHSTYESNPFGIGEKYYKSAFTLSYTHPLLRNKGGILDQLDSRLAEENIEKTRFETLENMESYLLSLAMRYMDWVALDRELAIYEARLTISQDDFDDMQSKRQQNLVTHVDVLRAEDSLRLAEQTVIMARGNLSAKRAELATLLDDERLNSALASFDLTVLPLSDASDTAMAELDDQSHTLRFMASLVAQASLRVAAAENRVRSDVKLVASAGLLDGEDSVSEAFSFRKNHASLGVNVALPLRNTAAESALKIEKQRQAQLSLDLERVRRDLLAKQRELLAKLASLRDVIDLNLSQNDLAQKKSAAELTLYEQGRSEYTFVIQSRDNQQNAALRLLGNQIRFHKLQLELDAINDALIKRALPKAGTAS